MSVSLKKSDTSAAEAENLCETTILLEKCSFTWIIGNFSYCGRKFGDHLISPTFECKVNGRCKWRLKLVLSGKEGVSKDDEMSDVGLFLKLVSGPKKVVATFTYLLQHSQDNDLKKWYADESDFSGGAEWGCPKLFSFEALKKRTFVDNILKIHVDVIASVGMLAVFNGIRLFSEHSPETLKHTERLVDDLADAFVNRRFTDIVINVEGKTIPAHQFVLALRSPVFAAAFEHETIEKASKCLDIKDFSYDTVNALLHFLYTGKVTELCLTLAKNLLKAADKYAVEDLKGSCEDFVVSKLDKGNVLDILLFADMHSAFKLKESAVAFICDNIVDFKDSRLYEPILRERPCLLTEILSKIAGHDISK